MTKVTVVTGYYNRRDALRQTIASILGQTYRDLELVVFDDCSTDGTAEALRALEEEIKDPRLRVVIHDANKGFVQGMIDALDATDGEFIAVQGSGDVSLPERIARQVALLEARPDLSAVGCWYTNVVADEGLRRPRRPDEGAATFEGLLESNIFSHGEVMMRRSSYEAAGGYRKQFKFCQDYDLWLRMVKLGPLGVVPEFLYDRYVRFDGVSYKPEKLIEQTRFKILATELACSSPAEIEARLKEVESGRLPAIVPLEHPGLQKALSRAALRSIVWGGTSEAREITNEYVVSPFVRQFLSSVTALAGSQISRAPFVMLRQVLGVRSQKRKAS
jgi:hypothetical protein